MLPAVMEFSLLGLVDQPFRNAKPITTIEPTKIVATIWTMDKFSFPIIARRLVNRAPK
jgi:hypothetical protein